MPAGDDSPVHACHECGLVQREPRRPGGRRLLCARCGMLLRRSNPNSIDRALHYVLGALVLFVTANLFPFLIFSFEGREQVTVLISGVLALWDDGMELLALLVLAVSIVVPAVKLVAALYALVPLRLGIRLRGGIVAFRLTDTLRDWAMLDVMLLAVIVAYVKMEELAPLELGPGLLAFVGCLVLMAAADATLDRHEVWAEFAPQATVTSLATQGKGTTVACHACDQLVVMHPGEAHGDCPRCGAGLHRRKPDSLVRTWALLLSAIVLYVPANLLPVMTIVSFGRGDPSTIMGGVILLLQLKMYPVAAVVFVASIVVPCLKLVALTTLLLSVHFRWQTRLHDRTRIFRMVELIGRWSMVDVFVVALLVALVSLGTLATVSPGLGMTAFGGTVVLTMLASASFDPRLMWDARRGRTVSVAGRVGTSPEPVMRQVER